jgi:hypothetical protein
MEHVAKGMPSGEKQARATTSDRGPPIHNLMLLPASLSPREMYARRCNDCELCKKPECGSCASCTNNKSASTDDEREVCLQKVGDSVVTIYVLYHLIGAMLTYMCFILQCT